MTLADAKAKTNYTLWLPDAPDASNGSIAHVCLKPYGDFEVAVEYPSGVRVYLNPDPPLDPASHYEELATELGAAASVETVHGVPALVIPENFSGDASPCSADANCVPPQKNPGSVDLVLDGVQVTVIGHLPASDLRDVAESLRRET